MQQPQYTLTTDDGSFLAHLRSIAIFFIVFGHIGAFWAFKPYSEFLHVFVPVFFFISGAVSLLSYNNSRTIADYYIKRFTGLLIPYYLLCAICLILYLIEWKTYPPMNISYLNMWIQLRPPGEGISPIPLGHIWFLHTLFFIILVSPLYFRLASNRLLIISVILIIVCMSGIQTIYDIDNHFYIFDNNLFKPIIHSYFFIFGFMYYSLNSLKNKYFLTIMLAISTATSAFLAYSLNLNIDYEFHTFAPDLYYVTGSFSAIIIFIIIKKHIVATINNKKYLKTIFDFIHYHTFSIYLLHVPVIFLFDTLFKSEETNTRSLEYVALKITFVFGATCLFSIPFSFISKKTAVALKKIITHSIYTINMHAFRDKTRTDT